MDIDKKKQSIESENIDSPKTKSISWQKMGLIYGVLMFCFTTLAKIISGGVTIAFIIIQIIIWTIGGLIFGAIMGLFLKRYRKKN